MTDTFSDPNKAQPEVEIEPALSAEERIDKLEEKVEALARLVHANAGIVHVPDLFPPRPHFIRPDGNPMTWAERKQAVVDHEAELAAAEAKKKADADAEVAAKAKIERDQATADKAASLAAQPK